MVNMFYLNWMIFYKVDIKNSPLGYDNVNWYVTEVIKSRKEMAFYFKKTKKDIVMTEDDEEDFKNNIICGFCEKNNESDKISDHCHLIGKCRGPAHNKYNNNVTQKKSLLIPFVFHNLVTSIVIIFLKS